MTRETCVADYDKDLDISKGFGENIGFSMILNGDDFSWWASKIESVSESVPLDTGSYNWYKQSLSLWQEVLVFTLSYKAVSRTVSL